MAVTMQPGFAPSYAPSNFQTGICDCCSDCGTLCLGLWCPMILGCTIASAMDECCCCGLHSAMRSVYRTKYNIHGSMCGDCLIHTFCIWCSACQLKRDIKRRKDQGIF